jgi:hypothetical protein
MCVARKQLLAPVLKHNFLSIVHLLQVHLQHQPFLLLAPHALGSLRLHLCSPPTKVAKLATRREQGRLRKQKHRAELKAQGFQLPVSAASRAKQRSCGSAPTAQCV